MFDSDRIEFQRIMRMANDAYGKAVPSQEALTLWFALLREYDIATVRQAFDQHMKTCQFAPVPAHIVALCKPASGHLPIEQAWALALTSQDERVSVVWTTQIAEAMGIAHPCLEIGDKFGARQAFVSAYEAMLKQPPCWTISLGHDLQGREAAVQEALEKRLLPPERVQAYLPYNSTKVVAPEGLLEAPKPTSEQQEQRAKIMAELRKVLQ